MSTSLAVPSDKNWACINGGDDDVNTINGAFLMSLMEELQDNHDFVEEKDEERLNSVIRSLEAEIKYSCSAHGDHDDQHRSISMDHDHDQSSSDGEDHSQMDGHDDFSIISFDHGDLDQINGWDFNMEVDHEACSPSSSSGNDDVNFYGYQCGDEIISSNYGDHNYYGVAIDHQDNIAYNSFWQDTVYDSSIINNNTLLL
ncbi:hypothetical protein CsatB_011953 [Cannabis sativa]